MEDYLEAIYCLQLQSGQVQSIDVAEYLKVSKPSVSGAMKALREKKLVVKEEDGVLHLTEEGKKLAEAVYEKHVFFQRMFTKLGVDEQVAGRDACLVEHAVSDEVFEKLKEKYSHVLENEDQ